jgi:23S rRNA (uracil1939-C5)-methyltransferase
VAPSPDRATPPCRHFGTCGGCTLQHWKAEPYATWKSGLLTAALRRAGFSPATVPVVVTPPHARRRIDLAVRRHGSAIQLGLHEARGGTVVDLLECVVLHPALATLLAPLRELLRGLSTLRRDGSAVLNLLDSGPDLLLRTDAPATATDRTRLAAFATAHFMPRITLAQGNLPPETACLLRPASTKLGGISVIPPPGAFLQASAPAEAAIVAAVLADLPDRLAARALVAELYAGCGTITFALATRVRVAAFEGDAATFAALRAATNAAKLTGRVEPHCRDLARQPLTAKELSAFAAVVLDPPYAGAPAQIGTLAASGVARIIYVSCNPAALARDAAVLHAAGYKLLAATPIDQFLWSARLESVSVFSR